MSDDQDSIKAAVKTAYTDASKYIDDEIAPERTKATDYYYGRPFGNEEEGRSQVVMTEVRDTVLQMMPSLLRVFCGAEKVIEYLPRKESDVQGAAAATDYIDYIATVDNDSVLYLQNAFKDALVRKLGILKWWLDESHDVTEETYKGLLPDQAHLISVSDGVEVLEAMISETDASGQLLPVPLTDLRIRRTKPTGVIRIEAVPTEEYVFSKRAKSQESATYQAHRRIMTVSELVALGFSRKTVLKHAGNDVTFSVDNQERDAREGRTGDDYDEPSSTALKRALFIEHYILFDGDEDGIAELHRVCTIGEEMEVLSDEVVPEAPFALFCPDPEAHEIIGQSIADYTMDIQKIKSNVVRNTLDSLSQSIHPRTGILEGMVNVEDVLNNKMGGIIRMKQPGAVQEFTKPFLGQETLGVIGYLDEIKASRTGITKASAGLDPDVLQSTTRAAVTATMQAASERLEMIARIFAGTGMKSLARGLLRLVCRHQDQAKVYRLRGEWVQVDPRTWDAEMAVVINVGLGRGDDAKQMSVLQSILAEQKEILQALGPNNPLVGLSEYRNTLSQMLTVAGFKDVTRFFKPVSPMADPQAGQEEKKEDPATMLVRAEVEKTNTEAQVNLKKIEQQQQDMVLDDQRAREKTQSEFMLKVAELALKYNQPVAAIIAELRGAQQIGEM